MNVSTLVIFVSDYPYGPGEPFLEEELKVISKKFDKIYLINFIEEERKLKNVPFEFYVPENSHVLFIKKGEKYANLKWLFSFTPIYEIFLAIFKHKKKFSISLFKLIYSYWIEGVRNEGVIKKIILDEKINIDSTVFYSYWCDTNCISLSNISKKNKLQFVTRLHGWDLYFERHNLKFLPFREKIFNEAFKVLPISNDGRKYILDNKFTISKNKVIESHLGVRDLSVNPRYLKIENSEKTLKIITISHINQVKSMDRLVDALVLIDNISIQWVHIGYGFEKFETDSIIEHIQKITIPEVFTYKNERKIILSDIDIVNHANNVKYLEWCLDVANVEMVLNNSIKALNLNYLQELNYNDTIEIHQNKNSFLITKEGKSCFALEIEI